MNSLIAGVILILCLSSYFFGRSEARKLVTQNIKLKALPAYYGYYLSLWCGLPALIIFGCWSLFEPAIIKVLILNNFPQIESKDLFYEQTLSFFNGNFSGEITNEIKAASVRYCAKKPDKDFEEIVRQKEKQHNKRMAEILPDDAEEMPLEAFTKACQSLGKKQGKTDSPTPF